ncbi:hypothetical protein [Novosphingobium sp. ST904]|uniref:hypothetical protein n=1 Tax=Novosphingobium sp. ST904 TaxID=1684385 RepID=UPI00104F14F1|nr:hypothetical protein [Novosphingobium sp. ST904]
MISRALPSGTALPIPGKSAALTGQAVRKACRKALRDPLVPFLMAGAALFAGYLALETTRREPIRYTPEAEAAMVEDFRTLTGRQPTAEDRARMKKDFITLPQPYRDRPAARNPETFSKSDKLRIQAILTVGLSQTSKNDR